MDGTQNDALYEKAKQLIDQGKRTEEIKLLLIGEEQNPFQIEELLKKLKKEKHEAALKLGKTKIGFAIALLATGFIISIIQYHFNHSFSVFLYGFTTIGTLVLFWGAYDIFN